jgi:hypothetical protein
VSQDNLGCVGDLFKSLRWRCANGLRHKEINCLRTLRHDYAALAPSGRAGQSAKVVLTLVSPVDAKSNDNQVCSADGIEHIVSQKTRNMKHPQVVRDERELCDIY